VNIGPVYAEIYLVDLKKEEFWKVKYIAWSASLSSKLNKKGNISKRKEKQVTRKTNTQTICIVHKSTPYKVHLASAVAYQGSEAVCLNTADYRRLPQTTTDYCRLTTH